MRTRFEFQGLRRFPSHTTPLLSLPRLVACSHRQENRHRSLAYLISHRQYFDPAGRVGVMPHGREGYADVFGTTNGPMTALLISKTDTPGEVWNTHDSCVVDC
jgi:hypothetical protein